MDTNFKGEFAKQKIITAAVEKSWIVSVPTMETRYDLLLDNGKKIYKVQCKYGDGQPSHSTGAVVVNLSSWQIYEGGRSKVKTYSPDEIDCVMAYLPKVESIIWLNSNMFINRKRITIRIEPPKNNQKKRFNFYTDFLNWND